jgi:hypothetical protein
MNQPSRTINVRLEKDEHHVMINFRYVFVKSILCQSFVIVAKDRLKTTHFQFVGNVRATANGVELS